MRVIVVDWEIDGWWSVRFDIRGEVFFFMLGEWFVFVSF